MKFWTRWLLFPLLLLSTTVVLAETDNTAAGEMLALPEEGFTVTFPEGFPKPFKETTTVTKYTSSRGNETCSVAISNTGPWLRKSPGKMALIKLERLVIAPDAGEDLQRQDYRVQSSYARSLRFSSPEGRRLLHNRVDFIVARPRVYQLSCVSSQPSDLDQPAIQTFFQSFRLTDTNRLE